MKLYASLTSPYARKVRICLIEMNLQYEFVVEMPSDPKANVAHLNPLGKVPLLQRNDGEVLFNSPMIIEYLQSLSSKSLSLVPTEADFWRVQRWHALGDGIMDAVVARMLELRRADELQDANVLSRQEGKVASALRFADENYKGGEYLEAANFSIADIAFAVALEYVDFRYPHDWRSTYPRLAKWLSGVTQRPSFNETSPPHS